MATTHPILNNETVPSGTFGDFETEGNAPGRIQFLNKGRVNSRVAIYGSEDGVNWKKIGKVKAKPGELKLKRLKLLPTHMSFHNSRAASGPAILNVFSVD